jgi:hypothetical protein
MSVERGAVLRTVRGTTSLQAFAQHLVANGLAPRALSRQRLSDVEQGVTELAPALWDEVVDALIRGGHPPEDVAPLLASPPAAEPVPPSTAGQRLAQWTRVVANVRENRWWRSPFAMIERYAVDKTISRLLLDRYDFDKDRQLDDLRNRLRLGATSGPCHPSAGDAVAVDRAGSALNVTVEHGELFVFVARLHNIGTVPWRNRLLCRLGPPVTSSLPFTVTALPVPDTEVGAPCTVTIPGRSQWFPNLAVVSYVMVFPDFTPCLPGRLRCTVDTRSGDYDRSFALPPGFPTVEAE